jgi:hypothetical protein
MAPDTTSPPPAQSEPTRVALSVSVQFHSQELAGLDVPIEVRRPNGVVVARTLCSQPVNVAPGRYFVSAILPGGQKLLDTVIVDKDPVSIVLRPEIADLSPHEWEEVTHYLGPPKKTTPEAPEEDEPTTGGVKFYEHDVRGIIGAAAGASSFGLDTGESLLPPPAFLRLFRGNPLRDGMLMPVNPAQLAARNWDNGRIVEFSVEGPNMFVQLLVPGAQPRNMTVPTAGSFPASVVITRDAVSGGYKMEAHVQHREAELLLRYTAQDAVQLADLTLESSALSAQRLMNDKDKNPIAAAVGAYALLRQANLSPLQDWTKPLCERFAWLPDGAAIRGEHLARSGRHAEAVKHFAMLCDRGLPIFADGLFYAYERMRWYAGLAPDALNGVDTTLVQCVLQPLRPFAIWAHRKRPILSYPGLDPRSPGKDVLPDDAATSGAIDTSRALNLSRWLSPLPLLDLSNSLRMMAQSRANPAQITPRER